MSLSAVKIPTAPHRPVSLLERRRKSWSRCICRAQKSYDYIPKQFRAENLHDGLMDNYKKAPEILYGLPREQLNIFTSENSILNRQASEITQQDSFYSTGFYNKFCNINGHQSDKNDKLYNFKERISMSKGRIVNDEPPEDLPSILLDFRIVFLGMPLYESVADLIMSQLLFLSNHDSSKPIYLYICSTGILDEREELVASEAEAYAIADMMERIKADVHTFNTGFAEGQAAMLLSRGLKGHRLLSNNCETTLYMPRIFKSSGPTSDMWIKAKDLEANGEIYLELLSESTGKSTDEIAKDIKYFKNFTPQEAIDYGLADRILDPKVDKIIDTSNKLERDANKAMREAAMKARSSQAPPGQVGGRR